MAKELGVTSKDVLAKLRELGEFVKSASSTVEAPVARRLRDAYPRPPRKSTPIPTKTLASSEAQLYSAIVDQSYDKAREYLRAIHEIDDDRARQLSVEIGALISSANPRAPIPANKAAWCSGLWIALSDSTQEDWSKRDQRISTHQIERVARSQPANTENVISTSPPTHRPEQKQLPINLGRTLEIGFVDLLRKLFSLPQIVEDSILTKLRVQTSGTQFGHDVEFDALDAENRTVRCHVECKNIDKSLSLNDVAAKILQTDYFWRDKKIDHFIVISPRSDATNELSLLAQGWNSSQRFPFEIHIWSPEVGVKELFKIAPEVHAQIYKEPAPSVTPEESSAIARAWRAKIRPIVRLPDAWKAYLTTPSDHCTFGEEFEHFQQVLEDPIELDALMDVGAPRPGTLRSNIHQWIEHGQERSLLLLAEFGEGKSFFTYTLSLQLAQAYTDNPSKGWIPLRIPLRSLRQAKTPLELLATRLADIGISVSQWKSVSTKTKTLVILDGFDEVSARLDPAAIDANIDALAQCIEQFSNSKIIVTSRSHFFEHLQDHKHFLDRVGKPLVLRIAPIPRERRLEHLDNYARQIGAYDKLAQLKGLYDPIGLAAKPLFLQMIKSTLSRLPSDHFNELVLYNEYVHESLEKKIKDFRETSYRMLDDDLIVNLETILEELAVNLHLSTNDFVDLREVIVGNSGDFARLLWQMSGSVSCADEHPVRKGEIQNKDARSRVGVRSLLKPIRGRGEDRWLVDFFHRSMREYFVARALVKAIGQQHDRAVDLLSHLPLQPEIVHFAVLLMRETEGQSAESSKSFTNKLLSLARSAILPLFSNQYLGGNALTLLYALSGELPRQDWSGLNLDFAYLAGAKLDHMSFENSSLRNANLDNTSLVRTDFRNADLSGVQLEETAPVVALAIDEDSDTIFVAYGDRTIRRWSIGAGGRATCAFIGKLGFTPQSLSLSPYRDLIITGNSQLAVMSGDNTSENWRQISRFRIKGDLGFLSVRSGHIVLRCAPGKLYKYQPDQRLTLTSLNVTTGDLALFLNSRTALVYPEQSDLTLFLNVGTLQPSRCTLNAPHLTTFDGRLLDEHTALVLLGHDNGTISLWKLTFDEEDTRFIQLWSLNAHAGSVKAVGISNGFVVSGGADRTVCLFPLKDDWQVGVPLRLHRTLQCQGMKIQGVKGSREHSFLRDLLANDTRDGGTQQIRHIKSNRSRRRNRR